MKLQILISSYKRNNVGKWITLPTTNHIISSTIEEICIDNTDKCVVTKYNSNLSLNNLDIVGYEDIYYINELVLKLNKCATNKKIVALVEVYSNNLEEILQKAQRGTYKFYPNKCLKDIAEKFSTRKPYKYYDDIYRIIEDLSQIGYEETSTGVIFMYEK